MSSEDSRRLRILYAAALQRDPEERDEYLNRECAGQPELRAKVAALLQAHAKDFLDDEDAASATRTVPLHTGHAEGKVIGPYIVRRELGRGGMGVVYLVDDTRLSRPVALKALAPEVGRDPSRRERLRLEARAAAVLSHPSIATVYSLDEIGDDLYLACEYVPGEPLRSLLAAGPLPIAQVVTIGVQLASALATAHTVGVIHRDIKPENVMKTPSGVVKILDFGLARMEGAATPKLTQTGVIVGTPAYMAPEQVLGQHVDFRTDLFALGVLIYELASGVNPFVAKTVSGTLARIVESEPSALSTVRPQIPPGLDRIVARCLRKDPAQRYESTLDLVADLEQLESELTQLRQRALEPIDSRSAAALGARRSTWWLTHQVIVVCLYVVAAWLGWHIKEWMKVPVTISVFIGLGAGAATGGVLRGHLVFTEYLNRRNLPAERRRVARALVLVDVLIGAALVADAIMLARWPLTAVLTMALGIGIALAALVLEPATTKATLEDT
ncbi:MAG TPA: serine/threonine-protein kinase [Vicinamibacterales bacterium]|nr:serine/threonine-protein kinase [Vicinamibacterales bacterium]